VFRDIVSELGEEGEWKEPRQGFHSTPPDRVLLDKQGLPDRKECSTMHVKWRGLELPARVERDEASSTGTFGRFTIEPFERGFGTTIGNSLRRILLSSIRGAAVKSVSIKGVDHEFMTMPGVLEDVTDILLNVKGLIIRLDGEEERTMRLAAAGPGEVTADLIEADTNVTILNPEHKIATLTGEVNFEIEMTVASGRGYIPASDHYDATEEQVIGALPLDSVFSPVLRVRYRVENTRVGQKTNFDRLVMDVWTDGTVSPEMSLVEAAKILRKHLNPFVQFFELGDGRVSEAANAAASLDEELIRKLDMPVAELELTVRSSNCLESARIDTVSQLVQMDEPTLLGIRSFGKTSLREIRRKLEEMGLDLAMDLPEGYDSPGGMEEIDMAILAENEAANALLGDEDAMIDDEVAEPVEEISGEA